MNAEQLATVCIGMIVQAMTFALGILVGASLRRRISQRQGSAATPEQRYQETLAEWHDLMTEWKSRKG